VGLRVIALDPDFPCYDITKIFDANHFTFDYYEEFDKSVYRSNNVEVLCYEYSEIVGKFLAIYVGGNSFEAFRILDI
jgi:hypothetical protein